MRKGVEVGVGEMRVGGWDCEEFRSLFLISISVSIVAVDKKRLG